MAIASFEHVSKTYRVGEIEVPVLKDISFTVEAEDMAAFVGPSGSGKTTVLNLLGLLDTPEAGSISIDGTDVSGRSRDQLADIRNAKLGFVFQSFNLIPVLSAFENVEFPLIISGMKDVHARKDTVLDILRRVGIEALAHRTPSQMSGGQQQRVAVARALVKHPKIILADEPTANLDSKSAAETLDLMRKMNEELKTTFIFSTHDTKIMNFAKRIITLEDGSITGDSRR